MVIGVPCCGPTVTEPSYGWKPGNSTCSRYSPAARPGKFHAPLPSVTAVFAPAPLSTRTVAPGITAPELSVSTPRKDTGDCAQRQTARNRMAHLGFTVIVYPLSCTIDERIPLPLTFFFGKGYPPSARFHPIRASR